MIRWNDDDDDNDADAGQSKILIACNLAARMSSTVLSETLYIAKEFFRICLAASPGVVVITLSRSIIAVVVMMAYLFCQTKQSAYQLVERIKIFLPVFLLFISSLLCFLIYRFPFPQEIHLVHTVRYIDNYNQIYHVLFL